MHRSGAGLPAGAARSVSSAALPPLAREIGRWAMVALMINGIIGAGIFGLPSKVHALAGASGLLAFAACALIIGCIALCFAEVSSRFTGTGGPYLYALEAFGDLAGFLVGWVTWLARVTALATISNVMASYLAFFWPATGAGWGRAAAMAAVTATLTAINLVGVRQAAGSIGLLTIGKLTPLVLFVGVGLFFIDTRTFSLAGAPDAASFTQAVLQLVFAFAGFEAVVVAAGESRDPRRDLPFALFVGLATATVLYILIQVVCIGTLPSLAASERPLADASVCFAGAIGGSVITVGALVSTIGVLCGVVLVAPRILYAMSERGQLPRALGLTHPRFHTPSVAILVTAAVGLALSISGTFSYLVNLNVIARLVTYASTAGALVVLRRSERDRPALFSVPAGGLVASLCLGACAWLLVASGARGLRDMGIAIACGLALFTFARRRTSTLPAAKSTG